MVSRAWRWIEQYARVGSNISPCGIHICQHTTPVVPGGDVFAIGRTSGYQSGCINGCTTSLRNDDGSYRQSEEWTIIRPQSQREETWVANGIGVSGDSGVWILENARDHLVGQVWGRDFQYGGENHGTGEIITYFTPIHEIFDDIIQSTGATEISISSNWGWTKEDKEREKKTVSRYQNVSGLFPLTYKGILVTKLFVGKSGTV